MPLGLVLSGLVVSMGEAALPRETAPTLPFQAAGLGSRLLAAAVWRASPRGFASIQVGFRLIPVE
jgi:hypothetical protein